MTNKYQYRCKTSSNFGDKGQIVALEIKPEDLTKRQRVMLEEYIAPDVKGLESGQAQTVDVESIKAEAAKEAMDALVKVYEFVTDSKIGNLKKPDSIAEKIMEALEANESGEDEQPE